MGAATSWIMIGGGALLALVTLNPKLLAKPGWRATATPLASIIGSGFLVAGPILAHAAGRLAVFAMLGLCTIAWLFGSAIRHNIAAVEPMLDDNPPRWLAWSSQASDLALALAYFISVAYYLSLFAAFGLRIIGSTDQLFIRSISSAVIIGLGLIGLARGLRWLENIELPAVGFKLALIGGLVLALLYADGATLLQGGLDLSIQDHPRGMREIQVLLGLIILVQGFETSRYLGANYDAALRIKTMRHAQMLATAIYVVFIALVTPYFSGRLPESGGETAIIELLQPLGWALAPLIIAIALASQLSAAVADMNGAGGLVEKTSGGRLDIKWGYAGTAAVALAITWLADIYAIIVYASKAFVLYYAMQSGIAAWLCWNGEKRQWGKALCYATGVVIAVLVVVLGIPAEGGG